MAMLVNRKPVDEETLEAIRAECEFPPFETIYDEMLTQKGRNLLRELLVEGRPADGITLHGTRWGRQWCAFCTVD